MDIKTITKAALTIHRNILIAFLIPIFILLFIYFSLLNGISINNFRYKNIKIEKLYLKWDNLLNIKIKKITITSDEDSAKFTYKNIKTLMKNLNLANNWINQIDIDEITTQDLTSSLVHSKNSGGHFSLKSDQVNIDGEIKFYKNNLYLDVKNAIYKELNLDLNLHIDNKNDNITSNISIKTAKNPDVLIRLSGNNEKISLSGVGNGKFYDIKPIVDIFELDSDISEWIIDRNNYEYVILDTFSGEFSYNDISELLDTLHISGSAYNVSYTFDDNLMPVKSQKVDIEFYKNRLHIKPNSGYFITTNIDEASVIIDFNLENPQLLLDIKTDKAALRGDITHLLSNYDIVLPIKQTEGSCDSSFYMGIDLVDLNIYAKGVFKPTPSLMALDDLEFYTNDGIVELENNRVSFHSFSAKLKDYEIFADVSGDIDSAQGAIYIDIKKAILDNLSLTDNLKLIYHIDSKNDYIKVSKGAWKYDNTALISMPLNIDIVNNIAIFKNLDIKSEFFDISAKANFNINNYTLSVDSYINKFNKDNISLIDEKLPIQIKYDENKTTLSSAISSMWNINNTITLISPLNIDIIEDSIDLSDLYVTFGDLFRGTINGEYNRNDKKGRFTISELKSIGEILSSIIKDNSNFEFFTMVDENRFKIDIPVLNTHFQTHPKGWKISIDDISVLSNHIPILEQYKIDNGYLNIYYSGNIDRYSFKGEIDYPYHLLITNNNLVKKYKFSGNYKDNQTSLKINDIIDVAYKDDTISIDANTIGIDLFNLIDFIKDTTKDGDNSIKISINATDSYLYLNDTRRIVADKIVAHIDDNFDAKLYHQNASANLKMKDGYFVLHGDGFNDLFMRNLLAFSDFKDGSMQLDVKGSKDAFDGVIRIENTIMQDYKVLNNTLAFINTIPNLATFSLPNYNRDGLPVKEIYGYFTYQNNKVNVDNFYIDSPEIKISGSTIADLEKNSINGSLNLKTTIGSSIGKIPMVGYILLGDDGSISTTLKISGSLDNPNIDTAIAKESVIAPFNILKRAIIYPFKWMID